MNQSELWIRKPLDANGTRPHGEKMRQDSQAGFSLASAIVAVAIMSIGAAALVRLMGDSAKSTQSITSVTDLNAVKYTLLQQLDCNKSLGVTPTTTLPLSCAGPTTTIVLRKADGSSLGVVSGGWQELGGPGFNWKIQGYCSGNALRVRARSKKPDAMLNTIINKSDVFDGAVEFCSQMYAASPTICSAPGSGVIGWAGSVPVCGKLGAANSTTPGCTWLPVFSGATNGAFGGAESLCPVGKYFAGMKHWNDAYGTTGNIHDESLQIYCCDAY